MSKDSHCNIHPDSFLGFGGAFPGAMSGSGTGGISS